MISLILRLFNYKIIYINNHIEYNKRYDSVDEIVGRPIHSEMSVAPPWSKMKIVKIRDTKCQT